MSAVITSVVDDTAYGSLSPESLFMATVAHVYKTCAMLLDIARPGLAGGGSQHEDA